MTAVHEAMVGSARSSIARRSADYLAKNYRFLAADPSFFWMKTVARFELAREWATRAQAQVAHHDNSEALRDSPLVRAAHDTATVLETLRTEGYYVGFTLAPDALSELLACAHSAICYGDRDPQLPFRVDDRAALESKLGRKLKMGTYFDQQLQWPVFMQLKRDRWLNAIARAYFGCDPVFMRSEVLWSFATEATTAERRSAAQVLHCDINGFKTLKFFFYLTDVAPSNGPHAYIKKGPIKRTLMHQLLGQRCCEIPEETLVRTYGADQLVTICGPAGSGFVGDPYYFHRGTHPTEGSRALLQIELGCRTYRTWYFDV